MVTRVVGFRSPEPTLVGPYTATSDREIMGIVLHIRFLLPTRLTKILLEITLLVQQSRTDQWNSKITG